ATPDHNPDYEGLAASAPATPVFKENRPSSLWQIETPSGPAVIKRFDHLPARQAFAAALGVHPAQREVAMNKLLADKGIAVVPILAHGRRWDVVGCRLCLMPPRRGDSVQQ